MPSENQNNREELVVECSECQFWRVILTVEEEQPADIIVEHGRTTGHTLTSSQIEE